VKDDEASDGVLCNFHDSILERIRITPRKQLGECAEELKKRTFVLPYNKSHFPVDKNKVMTKYLQRVIPNLPQEAPHAISIAGNDCIKEEKHSFVYKLHNKYLQLAKTDFTIYYVNSTLVNARCLFKDKEYENFRKEVLDNQSKLPMILSIGVNK
jgi:hypothetical protein